MKMNRRKICSFVLVFTLLFQLMPSSLISLAFADSYVAESPSLSSTHAHVQFLDYDDSLIVEQWVQVGGEAVKPENPNREDYSFTGWGRDGSTTPETDFTVSVYTTFKALYEPLEKYHILIQYIYAAGTPLEGQTAALSVDQYFNQEGYAQQSFESPAVSGYQPDTQTVDVSDGDFDAAGEYVYTVYYDTIGDVAYTVEHWFEIPGIAGDPTSESDYQVDASKTQILSAEAGSNQVAQPLAAHPGYSVVRQEEGTIGYDGNTLLRVFYNRNLIALSFDTAGGTYMEPVFGKYEAAVPTIDDPIRTGYTFNGWTPSLPLTFPADDAGFTAQWTAQQVDYTLIYWTENADDSAYSYLGTAMESALAGSVITLNASIANSYINDIDTLASNTTKRNEFTNYFTFSHAPSVTLAGDGSSIVNVYYSRNIYNVAFSIGKPTNNTTATLTINGVSYTSPTTYTITAKYLQDISSVYPQQSMITTTSSKYSFYGWSTGGSTWVSKRLSLTADMISDTTNGSTKTVTALYSEIVSYSLNYMMQSIDAAENNQTTLNSTYFPRSDLYSEVVEAQSNANWNQKNIEGFTAVSPNGVTKTGSNPVMVYLYYYRNDYTLAFYNYNTLEQSWDVYYEDDITGYYYVPSPPTGSEDFSFGGWYTTEDCVTGSEFNWAGAQMPSENVILYAKWVAPQYTVSFDVSYLSPLGEIIYVEIVLKGGTVVNVPEPTREGYAFAGWYLDTEYTVKFIHTQQIHADTTVYAKWIPENTSYTVFYILNDIAGTKIWTDKTVGGIPVGSVVTETARNILGYTLEDSGTSPQTITLAPSGNAITFVYKPFTGYDYTVRYLVLDGTPGDDSDNTVLGSVDKTTNASVVVEFFKSYAGYYPQQTYISRNLSTESNIITFYYIPYQLVGYTIEHYIQSDPSNPGSYSLYAEEEDYGLIGSMATSTPQTIPGYTYNAASSYESAIITDGSAIVLLLYYDTNTISNAIEGTKTLSGRTGAGISDTFSFTLDGGNTQTVTFNGNGTQNFSFPAITYKYSDLDSQTHSKVYTYTVAEVIPAPGIPGMTYDTGIETVTVTVSADANGAMSVVQNPEVVSFVNSYTASGSIALTGTKVLIGRELTASDVFTFTVTENGIVVATGTNDATGAISFSPISYTQNDIGTHTYIISENATLIPNIAIDTNNYTVTVEVSDAGDGTLTTTPVYPGGALTFTNTYMTTSVTMTKVWNDDNDRDGLRNDYTVQLYADAVAVGAPVTLDAAIISYTWDNLPVYNNSGSEIAYTVDETGVPTGYTKSVDGFTITNTHVIATTSVTMTKVWNDDNNRDGLRADYTVQLYGNGEEVDAAVILSAGTLTYTWDNLPVYHDGGTAIAYTVDETGVPTGYTKSVNGFTITNTHAIATTSVTMTKVWNDDNDRDGLRADYTVQLYGDGTEVDAPVILSAGTLTYTWDNLPVYHDGGTPIAYTVDETSVPTGYTKSVNGFTITNTHAIATTSVTMTKVWNDDNNRDGLRADYTVQLYGDGTPIGAAVTLTPGTLTYTWSNLPVNDNGSQIAYSLDETVVPTGYQKDINGFTITNTHEIATTSVTMIKVWNDDNNRDGLRADYTVQLYGDGVEVNEAVILSAGTLTYTWDNLPVYRDGGTEIEYTVDETGIPTGYQKSVNGYTITNTHAIATTSVTMTKVWNDDNNRDGLRADYTVQLYGDSAEVGAAVTLAAGTITYTWDNLPVYRDGGNAIAYSVDEVIIPYGYEKEINGLTITNSHTPETADITVTKVWDDNGDQDGKRPDDLLIILTGSDGNTYPYTLYGTGNEWSFTFPGLPVYYDNGTEIIYSVDEMDVPAGYTKSVDGFTITNTHVIATTSVTMTKVWDDDNDRDGLRADYTVQLYGDSAEIDADVILSAGTLSYTWDNLPVYRDGGIAINYTVDETGVPTGYTKSVNGFTITNSYTPETADVTVTKIWDDNSDQDGKRPMTLVVTLTGTDGSSRTETMSGLTDTWTYTFEDLPVYYNNGMAIDYTVDEETVADYSKSIKGLTITNSYTPETADMTVTKVWDDSGDQDGKRPMTLVVTLTGTDGSSRTETMSGLTDTWTYTFKDLPVYYNNGMTIDYTVDEETVADYGKSINGLTITNSYTPETADVTVTKIWDDENNRDGLRGDYTVQLYGDGNPVGSAVTLDAGTLTHTWNNLPVYRDGGTAIAYTVDETGVPAGYAKTVDGYTITNTHIIATTSVTVTKVWDDDNDRDGLRDDYTVQLYADAVEVDAAVTLNAAVLTYTWNNLPVYRDGGMAIAYTVDETGVPTGYSKSVNGFTITNTHTIATKSVTMTKVWNDDSDRDGLRADYTIQLYGDGVETGTAVTLTAGILSYTWDNLPVYRDGGTAITYTVDETGVPAGYAKTVDGFAITNTHAPETLDIIGQKTWNMIAGEVKPSVAVELYKDGLPFETTQLVNDEYGFLNLFRFEAGRLIAYEVQELDVPGYTSIQEGNNFINTADITSVSGTKAWILVPGETAPDLVINLLRNGLQYKTQTLTGGEAYYEFTGLPTHDNNGDVYIYAVEEVIPAGFTSEQAGNDFTNTQETTIVSGTKTWVLVPGETAPDLVINLLRNGVQYKTQTLTGGAAYYEFTGLPTHDSNGDAYNYTVEEVTPVGYTDEQVGNDFINTQNTTNVSGNKTWVGRVDVDNNPEITITLFRNGLVYATRTLASGTITYEFAGLPTHDALGNPYTYEVQEVSVPDGYTSESEINETNGKDFVNSYTASGTLDLSGTKTLMGREGTPADTFIFKLYKDEVLESNLLDTKTVTGGNGSFSFDQITYLLNLQADPAVNDLGNHTYIVVEEVPASNPSDGITYDTTQYMVNVTVTDNGDGTLDVSVTSENATSLDFENIYEAEGEYDVDLGLNPTKELAGRGLTAGEFTFELRQGTALLQTVSNTADGNIPFEALAYDEGDIGATYNYTIVEIVPSPTETGMTYDAMVLAFSVTVTDLGDGNLNADLTSMPADTIFNNSYAAEGEYNVDLDLDPTKELEGRDLTADEFTFELKLGDTVLQTKTNDEFGNIPFETLEYTQADIGHTYDYTITEMVGTETGMTYDSMVLAFNVVVTDLGNGDLSAVLVTQPADTVFNNIYEAEGEYSVDLDLDPTKELAGRDLKTDEFTFELRQGTTVLQTVSNTVNGNIPFLPLEYTQVDIGQTYDYSITEMLGTETGMTYDSMVLAFSVTVTDLGNGDLSAMLVAMPTDTVFNNSYIAEGGYDIDLDLDPTKALEGRDLTADEFTFELRQGTTVLQTVSNTVNGNIPFLPLEYTQDDIGQTYDYTITETVGTETGMTYDAMVLAFSVVVTDLGNGDLSAVLVAQPADTVFNNSYVAEGTYNVDLDLDPKKELEGRDLTADEFTFELKLGDTVLQTKTNDEFGNIPFEVLEYTQDDIDATYTYTIVEIIPSPAETGMTYDTMVLAFSVTVTDLGNGNLSADLVSMPSDTVFSNSYEAEGEYSVDLDLDPKKELEGRDLTADEFTFDLKLGDTVLQTVNNTADGNIPFLHLDYTQVDIGQIYDYTITETPGTETGMTYDSMVLAFSVIVTDLGNGDLSAVLVTMPTDTIFNNSYIAEGEYDIDLDLDPTKALEGRDLKTDEFTFELYQGTTVLQTVSNTEDGNIPFLPLEYTQADIGQTYDYVITETAGTEIGMTYDSMVLAFSVTVTDLGNGDLSAVLVSQPTDTIFNNSYVAEGTYNVDLDLNPTKELAGRDLSADEFVFVLSENELGGTVYQIVRNTADGNIPFLPLSYDQDDIGHTYDYVIVEVPGIEGGMTYDAMMLAFSVTIADLGNGILSAELVLMPEDTIFNNSYVAEGEYDVDLELDPTKELEGRALAVGEFTFELKQGDTLLQTVVNEADGNIPLLPLEFTQADIGQVYDYTITEVPGGETGMTYDSLVLAFSMTVTDLGNGVLRAALFTQPEDRIFNNSYAAEGAYDVDLDLDPTKELTGRDLTANEFTFELKQGDTVLQTAANEADGNIPFLPLTYTQADIGQTYEYTITEVLPDPLETYMVYDTMVLTFSVTIADLGNGIVSAELAQVPEDTTFNNDYDIPLTRYRIYYFYRMSEDDVYVLNADYNYLSALQEVGTRAGAFADRSENGYWQLVASDGNRRVLVEDEAQNVIRVYYQRAEVPLGGGVVTNVGDCSE